MFKKSPRKQKYCYSEIGLTAIEYSWKIVARVKNRTLKTQTQKTRMIVKVKKKLEGNLVIGIGTKLRRKGQSAEALRMRRL